MSDVYCHRTNHAEGAIVHAVSDWTVYRVCGLAVTACIAVKFGTAHGRSRPAVGSVKCIGSYGRKGVPPATCIYGTSQQKMIIPTELLRPIYNFYSLTICSLDQYLLNNSENKVLLP